nr:hypothetical protein [Tanacetum cinerariifolium]
DAKSLMEAIKKRFGVNKETKKVQKTLLKQQYENFNGSSSKSLDQIHDRLQKLISQLEILGESLSQEDINLKFLRSLPTEWRTHTLIWRNKIDLEDQSLDDLFNNLKIYKAEVKISAVASVCATSTKVLVYALPNVDLSDAIIYSFFASQSNSPQEWPYMAVDIDTLTQSMNSQPVVAENQPNSSACIQENLIAGTGGKEAESVQQYVLLPLWSSGSKDAQNTDAVALKVKEPKYKVHVSPSSSDKTKKHDEKTKREAKGKITAVGPNSTNNTNIFSAAGPSNTAVSPTFKIGGKSLFLDHSQYHDDPNMPALEDITYSDDEEDVGAEADFSNLETCTTVSPILTIRVHKDPPITQIIGDLSSAPQTRSMT